jgi:uncharacterized protein (TIGR03067 family)
MLRLLCLSLVLMCSPVPAVTGDDKKDEDAIRGVWLAAEAELGGNKFPDDQRKSIKLELKDGKYTLGVDKGTIKLDPSAKPKTLDVVGTDGPNKGKTIPAIYELDGDTLKVCYDLGGKARPTEFKTAAGTKQFLVVYKREKK